MSFLNFYKKVILVALITFGLFKVSKGQFIEFEEPKRLFTSDTAAVDEIMPMLTIDGNTMYFVRAFHPKNTGGIWGGHDIWYCLKDDKGQWSEPKNMGSPLNNNRENAVVGISRNGRTLYLLNEYLSKNKMKSGISYSNLVDGKWSQPVSIEIPKLMNKTYFSGLYMHYDEKVLLMSTEGNVSFGKQDIYVSLKDDSTGKWSIPINVGREVNSKGIEISPFLSLDTKTLYFSSDGRKGKGRMDVFSCKRLDDTWTNCS